MSRLQHGQARARAHTKEYDCWVNMRDRCRNPRRRQYPDYGGRGIKVCERWAKFENFFADMGRFPVPATQSSEWT